jgi:hypothetical protein
MAAFCSGPGPATGPASEAMTCEEGLAPYYGGESLVCVWGGAAGCGPTRCVADVSADRRPS